MCGAGQRLEPCDAHFAYPAYPTEPEMVRRRAKWLPMSKWPTVRPLTKKQRAQILARLDQEENDTTRVVDAEIAWTRGYLRDVRWLVGRRESGMPFVLYVDEISDMPHKQVRDALSTIAITHAQFADMFGCLEIEFTRMRQAGVPVTASNGIWRPARRDARAASEVPVTLARVLLKGLLRGYETGEVTHEQTLRQAERLRMPTFEPAPYWLRDAFIELARDVTPKSRNCKRPKVATWLRLLGVKWVAFLESSGVPSAEARRTVCHALLMMCGRTLSEKTLRKWCQIDRRVAGVSRRRGRPTLAR